MLDDFIDRKAARVRLSNEMISELAQVPIAIAPAECRLSRSFLDECSYTATRFQDA